MNDIDSRLRHSGSKPNRELGADFTINVLASLDKKPGRRPKWKEYIQVKFHKPAIVTAAFVATLVAGGSAYAAVGGVSGVRALFGGQKDLDGGARIVQVDTQHCPHIDSFNVTDPNRTAHGSYYYRIKAGSKFTNQQVVDMVQGACEVDAESVVNSKVAAPIEALPENKDKLVGGYIDSVITAITPSTLTVSSAIPYGSNQGTVVRTVTQAFGHIDPHAVVINNGVTESFDTLKVGDHITVEYRATGDALRYSETLPPDQVDASEQTVVIVTRISKSMTQYLDYQKYNSREFEQVAPCHKDPSGYCTDDQYQS
jgi:hypothetical protein